MRGPLKDRRKCDGDKDQLVEFGREIKKRPGLSEEDAAVLAATK